MHISNIRANPLKKKPACNGFDDVSIASLQLTVSFFFPAAAQNKYINILFSLQRGTFQTGSGNFILLAGGRKNVGKEKL